MLYSTFGDRVVPRAALKKMLQEKQIPLNPRITLSPVRGRQKRRPKKGRFVSPIAVNLNMK